MMDEESPCVGCPREHETPRCPRLACDRWNRWTNWRRNRTGDWKVQLAAQEAAKKDKETGSTLSKEAPAAQQTRKTRGEGYNTLVRPLYDRGMTDTEIAEELGTARSHVCRWRNQHDLPPNKPGPTTTKKALERWWLDRD